MAKKTAVVDAEPKKRVVSEERDLEVEKRMHALYTLQRVDSKIDEIRILRGELPLEVQDLKDDIAGFATKVESVTSEIEEIAQNISDRKASVVDLKAQIKKYEKQLKDVKNNREYDALSKEVEYQGLEIQLHDKRIKEANATMEIKKVDLERVKYAYDERVKDLEMKESELASIIAETEKEEKILGVKSEELKKDIDNRWLRTYNRIRANAKNGLAVVAVERDACGGCFSKIPPQKQIEVSMRKSILSCEYCGRIFVDIVVKEDTEGIVS